MTAIEKRLLQLENKIDPPGLLFATVHVDDPHTFPPGKISAEIYENSPKGINVISGCHVESEAEALRYIRQKAKQPVVVYCLQGGGWPEYRPFLTDADWQRPELVKVFTLLQNGKIADVRETA